MTTCPDCGTELDEQNNCAKCTAPMNDLLDVIFGTEPYEDIDAEIIERK